MKTFGENNNKPTTGPTVSVKTETAGKIGLIGAVTIIIGAVAGLLVVLALNSFK